MNRYGLLSFLCTISVLLSAQSNNNGSLDLITELSKKLTFTSSMSDGVRLASDLYMPITSDDLKINLQGSEIVVMPKGSQWIAYPSQADKFQLPMLSLRSVYNPLGHEGPKTAFNLLGYSYLVNVPRGNFQSEGIYHPYINDGWKKEAYHNTYAVDQNLIPLNDVHTSNKHEDGWDFYQDILTGLDENRVYNNGSTRLLHNGSLGLWGGSNLGINQYLLMSSRKVNPLGAGLKSSVPMVATDNIFSSAMQQNGMFRQGLVKNWLGVLYNVSNGGDASKQNNIHTAGDYAQSTKSEVVNHITDRLTSVKYNGTHTYMYPSSGVLLDYSIKHAPVDNAGNSAPSGSISRYTNMEVPTYHFTGWYDTFGDGQIQAWRGMKDNLSTYNNKQKLVIGPWGHTTIGGRRSGDITYPESVTDVLGFDFQELNTAQDMSDMDLYPVVNSEIFKWYYSTLTHNNNSNIGEPHFFIPQSSTWQNITYNGVSGQVLVPREDYQVPMHQFLNYLGKKATLPTIPVRIKLGLIEFNYDVPIDPVVDPMITLSQPLQPYQKINVEDLPPVRMYVIGNVNDGINADGGYWLSANNFPIPQTTYQDVFLSSNGGLSTTPPSSTNGSMSFIHDPNNPIKTVGGHNFIFNNPDNSSPALGQVDLKRFSSETLASGKVVTYETPVLSDSVSFVGYPKMTLYAASLPQGGASGNPTDADFVARLVDVYPNGKEFFITEGSVNARAREYVKSLYNDAEDINAPYSNINSGQVYEYKFKFLPIAYTLARGHKLKLVISGASYPRYQSNPNIPIMDGDFFRREPNDGKSYVYNGQTFTPRIATNEIHASSTYATKLELPILGTSHIPAANAIDIELAGLGTTVLTNTVVHNGWTYYEDPNNAGKYLFAIEVNPTGGNTQPSVFRVTLVKQTTPHIKETTATADASYSLSRDWNMELVSGGINGNINIRFYHDQAEVVAMNNLATTFKATNNGTHLSDVMWIYGKDYVYSPPSIMKSTGYTTAVSTSAQDVTFGSEDNVAYVQYNGVSFISRAGGSGMQSVISRKVPNVQKGTLRYNKEIDTFQGWNGTEWIDFGKGQ